MRVAGSSLGLVLALTAAATGEPARPEPPAPPITIFTTFHPTAYFARRIGGDRVKVECPLPADADPAYWQPDREVVAAFQKADLIVVNGAEFEKWIGTTTLPPSRLVVTAKPFAKEWIVIETAVTHSHGAAGKHSHEGVDGHTWVDPVNAKAQAQEIEKALLKKLGDDAVAKAATEKDFAALAADLDALDAGFRALGKQPDGVSFYCAHPAYNYLARRYGWRVVNFALDPGEMPSDQQFAEVRKSLVEKPARHLLWEAEPLPAIRERVKKELGLESVVVEPGENPSAEDLAKGRDFLVIQRSNVQALAPCFAKP